MQIIKQIKHKTLSDHLNDCIKGEVILFDLGQKNSVRAAIQRVAIREGKKFTTKKKGDFLEVTRLQ